MILFMILVSIVILRYFCLLLSHQYKVVLLISKTSLLCVCVLNMQS